MDLILDGFEVYNSLTNPLLADSNGNGVSDAEENPDDDAFTNLQEQPHFTAALNPTVDGAGYIYDYQKLFALLNKA